VLFQWTNDEYHSFEAIESFNKISVLVGERLA
jgi:hypothetical protein